MSIFDDLSLPFAAEAISWRTGATNAKKLGVKPWQATSGIALAYLTARDVMQRLDDVVGFENWQDRYPYAGCCELSIYLNGVWITKSDASGESDIDGIKGQSSGAFKRAAVKFGVGRYLYDLPTVWCDLKNGQIQKPPKLPAWAVPLKYTEAQKALFDRQLATEEALDFYLTMQTYPVGVQTALHNSFPKGEITSNKKRVRELETAGATEFRAELAGMRLAIKEKDEGAFAELSEELGALGKRQVFDLLTEEEQITAKEMSVLVQT